MTEFSVVYFEYDKQFTPVAKTKLKLLTTAEAGAACSVPFDTLQIGDDGREVIATEFYNGTIICSGQVKKRAVEIAKRCQSQLEANSSSLEVIIEQYRNESKVRKRDSAGKMAAAILELQPESNSKPSSANLEPEIEPAAKKGQNRKIKSLEKKAPEKVTKKSIHPEKMAEMLELVGENTTSQQYIKLKSRVSPTKKSLDQSNATGSSKKHSPAKTMSFQREQNKTPKKHPSSESIQRSSIRMNSSQSEPNKTPKKHPSSECTERSPVRVNSRSEPKKTPKKRPLSECTQRSPVRLNSHSEPKKTPKKRSLSECTQSSPVRVNSHSEPKKTPKKHTSSECTQRSPIRVNTSHPEPNKTPRKHHLSKCTPRSPVRVNSSHSEPNKKRPSSECTQRSPNRVNSHSEPNKTPKKSRLSAFAQSSPVGMISTDIETRKTPKKHKVNEGLGHSPIKICTSPDKTKTKNRNDFEASTSDVQTHSAFGQDHLLTQYNNFPYFQDLSPIKNEISETSRWDNTFVGSAGVLLDMEQPQTLSSWTSVQDVHYPHCNQTSTPGPELQLPQEEETRRSTSDKDTLCKILRISMNESQFAGRLLHRIADVLTSDHHDQDISSQIMDNFDSCNFGPEDTINSQPCTVSKSEHEENLGVLITDPNNPDKFSKIRINKVKERQAIIQAESSKKPAVTLLNGILSCVFTEYELSNSSGLGLRKSTDEVNKPLDSVKMDAVRGYIRYYCKTNKWEEPTISEFNKVFTNKVTNTRKKLNKSPKLKTKNKSSGKKVKDAGDSPAATCTDTKEQ